MAGPDGGLSPDRLTPTSTASSSLLTSPYITNGKNFRDAQARALAWHGLCHLGITVVLAATLGCSLVRGGDNTSIPEPPKCRDLPNGGMECTIVKPGVHQPVTDYPSIRITPGMRLTMNATGCVQTGGLFGRTWKRYVDPQGPHSDRRYHGTVRLPADVVLPNGERLVREQMVRIAVIRGAEVQIPQGYSSTLRLGYEDDVYRHNSYDRPDEGWGDQCSGQGVATVVLTLQPGGTAPPGERHAAFDVVSTKYDPNQFWLNPQWGYQTTNRDAGGHGYLPDANALCYGEPDIEGCTSPTTATARNVSRELVPFLCGGPGYDVLFPGMGKIRGHVNWAPATYEGTIAWEGHSVDDDQNFRLVPMDGSSQSEAGLTTGNDTNLELEFDSRETLQRVEPSSPFWQRLKQHDNTLKQESYRAVVTGLLNLDCVHHCKSELHPVYAMAVLTKIDAAHQTDTWELFVRNWGNQGECSERDNLLVLPSHVMKIHVWRPDVSYDAEVTPRAAFDSPTGPRPITSPAALPTPEGGATVAFRLLPSQDVLFGTLTFHWHPLPGAAYVAAPALIRPRGVESEDRTSPEEHLREVMESTSVSDPDSVGAKRRALRDKLDSRHNALTPAMIADIQSTPATPGSATHRSRALCLLFDICEPEEK